MTEITNSLMPLPAGQLAGQADTDQQVLELWVHGRSPHTQRGYRYEAGRFLAFMGAPLAAVHLGDLQAFADSLVGAPNSRGRCLAAVKSLLSFAHRLGYLQFDVGAVLPLPHAKDGLAERILPQNAVFAMLRTEENPRNACLLRLLYVSGVRVSELCGLKWRDVQPGAEDGQIVVYGKGGKTRSIKLTTPVWSALAALRCDAGADDPVFLSRNHGQYLHPNQVHRIVGAAAKRAGLTQKVSPHWMRHAHASHALDNGCPIHLVQATLGHASVSTTGKYLHAKPTDSSARFLTA